MITHPLDLEIYKAIHSLDCSMTVWAKINLFVTQNGLYLWLLGLLVLAFWRGKAGWYPFCICLSGMIIAWFIGDEYLKPFFGRLRPFNEFPELCVIGHRSSSFSFPSGHTITSMSMAMLITLFHRQKLWIGALAFVFAAFVAYTRMYLGVHYLTDILGGTFFGVLIAIGWYMITEWSRKHYPPPDSATGDNSGKESVSI